jgi:hypothetical protein
VAREFAALLPPASSRHLLDGMKTMDPMRRGRCQWPRTGQIDNVLKSDNLIL